MRIIRAKWLAGELSEAEATAMLRGKHPAEAQEKIPAIPTPTVQDGKNDGGPSQHERNSLPLNAWIQHHPWPTPDKGMADGGRRNPEGTTATGRTPDGRKVQVGLTNAVQMWPTPRHEGFDAGGHRGTKDSLHSAIKAWATPQHHDAHVGQAGRVGRYGTLHGGRNLNDDVAKAEGLEKAKLSAAWTLALMGFPPTWCDDLPPDPLSSAGTPT